MSEITIDSVNVAGGHVQYETSCSGSVQRFFTGEDFEVTYGTDVSSVPESILVIPVLSQICPVAWANGATVHTPIIDEEFGRSLRRVQDALVDMYPAFMEGGKVTADRVTASDNGGQSGTALLFTGGVDSTATYLNHREKNPHLVTVQGWVFTDADSDQWSKVRSLVQAFAAERESKPHFIESNIKGYLNGGMLDAHYRQSHPRLSSWYPAVGCGLGLLGICAPLATATGIGDLHIAGTYHDGVSDGRWGSHPDIDNEVQWSGTRCFHDGYSLSRQDKIEKIATRLAQSDAELTLQTCNETVENCSRCAKCARTIVGLLVAGVDPNRVGYDFDRETLAHIQTLFERPAFYNDEDRWDWEDLQRTIDLDRNFPSRGDEVEQFLRWFAGLDLEQRMSGHALSRSTRFKLAVLRNLPYGVYSRLSALSTAVRRR